jgi:hypothetical protein
MANQISAKEALTQAAWATIGRCETAGLAATGLSICTAAAGLSEVLLSGAVIGAKLAVLRLGIEATQAFPILDKASPIFDRLSHLAKLDATLLQMATLVMIGVCLANAHNAISLRGMTDKQMVSRTR